MKTIQLIRDATPVEEDEVYYFEQSPGSCGFETATIGEGTAMRCEKCHRACIVNAVTITGFHPSVNAVKVATELKDPQELGHCEELDMALCETCYEQYEKTKGEEL